MENSGVIHMIQHNRTSDLACMYKLLKRVDQGLKTMCSTISGHLRVLGRALVAEDESTTSITYVQVRTLSDLEFFKLALRINHTSKAYF